MVECDVSNCSRLTALFIAPYIAKNENDAKHSSAEYTGSLHSVLNGGCGLKTRLTNPMLTFDIT